MTQTGVQILYGFLLILPFQARFQELGQGLVPIYLAAVVLATVATALVVAPVAVHRALFRLHAKRRTVDTSDLLAKIGLGCLAAAFALVTGLVFGVVLGGAATVVAALVAASVFLLVWLAIPLALRAPSARLRR